MLSFLKSASALLLAALLLPPAHTIAAAQPPASGPPPVNPTLANCTPSQNNAPCRAELGLFLVTNTIRTTAQAKVDATNQQLQAQGRSARASIESLRQWAPARLATDMPDRPNSWFVRVPYILTIKVAIPVTSDRHIGIPIDVNVFCENWQTTAGQIAVHARPGPASFEGGNILEDVFNVGNYIDGQVRSSFSAPSAMSIQIPNSTCIAISGSSQGTPDTGDDVVSWTAPRRILAPTAAARPTIEVTFNSLKRLQARSPGGILYGEVENILLNAYANTDGLQKPLTMREGDVAALNLPPIRMDAGKFDQLVVIGNIDQPPNNPKDSSFAAFPKSANYGPGAHTLQIPKWYSRPPDRFNRKPTWVSVPAYELAYTVRYLNTGELVSDGGAGPITPPKPRLPLGTKTTIKLRP